MSYPYPAPYPPPYQPVPRPVSTSTTGPKVLTFIGIAVLVLSIGMGVGGGVLIASGVSSAEESDRDIDTVAIATIQPGQTETVELDSRTSYTLRIETDGSVGSSSRPTVTDPDGDSLMVSTSSGTSSSREADESLRGWRFTSQQAGRYEITAASGGPTLQLVQSVDLDALIDGFTGVLGAVGGGFLITGALMLGAVGLGLLIGGIVWWSARSKNARLVAQSGHPVV